jgi:transposase
LALRPGTLITRSQLASWRANASMSPSAMEAIAEAVQRPAMKFVATKTSEQLDLQALHRVRERLVSRRTGIINQIRAFLQERGIAVRQGQHFLRAELPRILGAPSAHRLILSQTSARRGWAISSRAPYLGLADFAATH